MWAWYWRLLISPLGLRYVTLCVFVTGLFTFWKYISPLGLCLSHWDLLFFDVGTPQFSQRLVCTYFVFFVCSLQGARALSTFVGRFKDPELSRLASCLPLRCLGAKADSTTERYSRAFEKFRVWAAGYKEISVLPSNYLSVATYLESLLQRNSPYSALEAAVYGIRWAHNLFGLSNPCESNLVKGILGSAKRSLSRRHSQYDI